MIDCFYSSTSIVQWAPRSVAGFVNFYCSTLFVALTAISRQVYWPGSGIYCPDPELLEIGDDVVFGSRSEIFTTGNHPILVLSCGTIFSLSIDRLGSANVKIGAGGKFYVMEQPQAQLISFVAMIADRVVLMPGATIGKCTVMGSGALGLRATEYKDGSTWLGRGTCRGIGDVTCIFIRT